jgi:hypothetical protein
MALCLLRAYQNQCTLIVRNPLLDALYDESPAKAAS